MKPGNKKRTKLQKFLMLVVKISMVMLLFLGIFVGAWWYTNSKGLPNTAGKTPEEQRDLKNLNVLFLGVDKDQTRTDVMILGTLDLETKKFTFTSLPRDTYVKLPEDMIQKLKDQGKHVPSSGVMKLNAIHAFGQPNGVDYLKEYLEKDLLGIKIDHYVKVNFEGFRKIIDEVGGIQFDVPRDMHYVSKAQNLVIDLKKGPQKLDGKKAEELVRFRKGYAEGDLGRIKMQQAFIKAAVEQTLSLKNILKIPSILNILKDDMQTDFNVVRDGMAYGKAAIGFNMKEVTTQTLPGYPEYRGGVSYYIADDEKVKAMMEATMNPGGTSGTNKGDSTSTGNNATKVIKTDLQIKIYNGTRISGLASAVKEFLVQKGYNVVYTGNYSQKGVTQTDIRSKNIDEGKEVFKDLGIGNVFEETNEQGEHVVSIILGEDASSFKK